MLLLQVSHFTAAAIFSFFASIVFGITQRNESRAMMRFAAYCFAVFMGGLFLAGWFMWFLHH
jgi:hypothetical protein